MRTMDESDFESEQIHLIREWDDLRSSSEGILEMADVLIEAVSELIEFGSALASTAQTLEDSSQTSWLYELASRANDVALAVLDETRHLIQAY